VWCFFPKGRIHSKEAERRQNRRDRCCLPVENYIIVWVYLKSHRSSRNIIKALKVLFVIEHIKDNLYTKVHAHLYMKTKLPRFISDSPKLQKKFHGFGNAKIPYIST
jgi:hypothetical protein